mmetsp:Transcript_32125/g.75538  ORF Transcript_32125/g.75538 Transcript_32125/m.75538 type:complete len:259 (+) Transcript_32125:1467-2243(+)
MNENCNPHNFKTKGAATIALKYIHRIMSTTSNKRKAIDLDDTDIATLINFTKKTEIQFQNVMEQLASLTQQVHDLEERIKANETFQKLSVAIKEEDTSEDDESVVDETDKWEIMFRQLRHYRIVHGDCQVPQKYAASPKLGKWLHNQKTLYNNVKTGKKRKIQPEKVAKLDSLGLHWGKKYPAPPSWDEMYESLKEYQQRMENCNVPFHPTTPTVLARWAAYQRTEYKRFSKGKDSLLTLDQIGQLETIGMNWKGPKL